MAADAVLVRVPWHRGCVCTCTRDCLPFAVAAPLPVVPLYSGWVPETHTGAQNNTNAHCQAVSDTVVRRAGCARCICARAFHIRHTRSSSTTTHRPHGSMETCGNAAEKLLGLYADRSLMPRRTDTFTNTMAKKECRHRNQSS